MSHSLVRIKIDDKMSNVLQSAAAIYPGLTPAQMIRVGFMRNIQQEQNNLQQSKSPTKDKLARTLLADYYQPRSAQEEQEIYNDVVSGLMVQWEKWDEEKRTPMNNQSLTNIQTVKRFRLYLVHFPLLNTEHGKVRPCISLSQQLRGEQQEAIFVYLTSNLEGNLLSSDIIIEKPEDVKKCGLHQPSRIRPHKIMTIPKASLILELGSLPNHIAKKLTKQLTTQLLEG